MVFDISKTSVTDLARNENLINMLIDNNTVERIKGVDSVKTAIQHLDEIYTTAKSFEVRMSGKKNTAVEAEPTVDYGDVCPDCGGPLQRAGVCWVCYAGCGASTGGCS